MKRLLTLYLTIGLSHFCFSQIEANGVKNLLPHQLKQDFSILRSSLVLNHPDLYLYCSKEKMDSLFLAIEDQLIVEMTPIEFMRLLTPIHHLIGNNHTLIMPPRKYINYINTVAKRIPFSLYYINNNFFVSVDGSNEYTLKEGVIIATINGMKIEDIIDHIATNITIDGYNKISTIARATKAFSRFYAYYYGLSNQFKIDYFDLNNEKQTASIAAITKGEIEENLKLRAKYTNESEPERGPFEFKIKDGISILTISTFAIESKKKYTAFLNRIFKRMTAENIKSLILDVRNNRGGYPEAGDKLLAFLIEKTISPNKLEYAITKDIHNEQYFVKGRFYKHFKKQKFEKKGDK